MVIYLTLLSVFLAWEFPLTPRRVSLINIFAIGLPAFIIALKNVNTSKLKNFTVELFSFVLISAAVIVGAAYAGANAIQNMEGITHHGIQMAMLSVMIILTAANFLAVALYKGEKNMRLYIIYAIGLVGLYLFLGKTQIDFVVIDILKKFYEISYLEPAFWTPVFTSSIIGAVLLTVLQIIRKKIIFEKMKSR